MLLLKNIALPIVFLLTGLVSCTTEGCYEDTDSEVLISLNETEDNNLITVDSITVFGLGMESDSLYKNESLESLSLPLNPGSDRSVFVIINGLKYDTITINYSSRHNFISKGCGYNYLHQIESVEFTRNKIDTILIISNSVTPSDEENLRTFF